MGSENTDSTAWPALHTREQVIHAEMIRAGIKAARFFDQQQPSGAHRPAPCSQPVAPAVRALANSVRQHTWLAETLDTEGGLE